MKNIKRRTVSLLILAGILFLGLSVYIVSFVLHGSQWATAAFNSDVYSGGQLAVGTVYDRNGVYLAGVNSERGRDYAEDWSTRVATVHAVGDPYGNIGTGALSAFSKLLTGYNILSGTYSVSETGQKLYLTIDSELNRVAYDALGGRNGAVALCNYKTGAILCMVSTPGFDPANMDDSLYERTDGVFMNRFLSSAFTPGSVFKLITLTAALENLPDLYDRIFNCPGSVTVGGDVVTCTGTHGDITIEEALAVSCNCAFAELALDLGADVLQDYCTKLGITESVEIDGIHTAAGSFTSAADGTANLAWSGIGQYEDLVNPASFLRFMCAAANDGKAHEMRLVQKVQTSMGLPAFAGLHLKSERLLSSETASEIKAMMSYNVVRTYGTDNFPGLDICAKSGTAEVGEGQSPHAWFAGFLDDPDNPIAFVVMVENGGWGSSAAGSVANMVLQAAVDR